MTENLIQRREVDGESPKRGLKTDVHITQYTITEAAFNSGRAKFFTYLHIIGNYFNVIANFCFYIHNRYMILLIDD